MVDNTYLGSKPGSIELFVDGNSVTVTYKQGTDKANILLENGEVVSVVDFRTGAPVDFGKSGAILNAARGVFTRTLASTLGQDPTGIYDGLIRR